MANSPSGDSMTQRIVRVLETFTTERTVQTASEIGRRADLPSSTAHRLVDDLVAEGLLERDDEHRVRLGMRLWELGELSPVSLRLRETALPHMLRLYEATGENVHLAVLDAPTPETASALYVGRITGSGSIPVLSRMGGRHPLHTTGVGKALLATRDDLWLERFLARPLERETTRSITTEAELRADLERTRARGFATTHEEMTLGNVSVAAALGPIEGLPPSAVGVVVHLARADERRLGPLVVQAARDIRSALLDSPRDSP